MWLSRFCLYFVALRKAQESEDYLLTHTDARSGLRPRKANVGAESGAKRYSNVLPTEELCELF